MSHSELRDENSNGRITFEKLANTRDLGGIPTSDGRRIIAKRLLRSGTLYQASDHDIEKLTDEYRLHKVVDLRTEEERSSKPDPAAKLKKVNFIDAPILSTEAAGITHGSHNTLTEAAESIARDPIGLMTSLYPKMVTDPKGEKGIRTFFDEALTSDEGSMLWHCSMGKDRVGITTYLLLTVLGVSHEVAVDDYLSTNKFVGSATQDILATLASLSVSTQVEEGIRIINSADIRFLQAALDAIDVTYVSMSTYLREIIGITTNEEKELRAKYLVA